jgi:cell division protein FtsZ
MSIELTMPELTELKPKILVIGVGGAGGNAVNNMIGAELQGVDFVAANTDAQALALSQAGHKIQLGTKITQGLGAGSRPDVGRAAAEENLEAIGDALAGCNMAFITAGMGGGTGTGGAPVVARLAKEKGILTVGVVTKPFQFEGSRRMTVAEDGIKELAKHVDTIIIIPNQNLFRIANEKTTFADAFGMADEVLHSGVRGITDLMVCPGLINLDFADVSTVMSGMGKAMMGTGEAEGENRALTAAEAAISNPLLDDVSMKGAKGVIINITGGMDLTLFEVDEAANHVRDQVDPEANIIVGSAFMEELNGCMRVSVVATGVGGELGMQEQPLEIVGRSASSTLISVEETSDSVAGDIGDLSDDEVIAMVSLGETMRELQEENTDLEESESGSDDAFVPDAPADTGDVELPAGRADAFAEAAMANAAQSGEFNSADEAPEPYRPSARRLSHKKRSGKSLFERLVAGAARNDDEVAPKTPEIEEGGLLGRMMPEDRPVPDQDDDQLEIPSFLKRRTN